ncbi:FHA domain-containing protein [Pseudanabaena sp. FACHB-2040]|uniref:FHA domain-containing protein n=1 Tax=Pseudanabaena sp. FACHB-2040 TaxID=2692859 RepID=UPI001683BC94|nr:FHA domain-containing protein [Pseudanabaena sp. FACHB-2040]MBD2259958.1 FHA domain-containing protein [Pseudanabaena sp. FACHB-2040]
MTLSPFSSSNPHRGTLTVPSLPRVRSHSQVLETLFCNFDFDLEQVSNTIDPILTAQSRCEITSLYIQGIISGSSAFLCTNINDEHAIHVTTKTSSWLVGQSARCAITIPHSEVSACHAAIGYQPDRGFFITDVGSSTGTWINRRQLEPHQRRTLYDGDLLELGSLQVEFFVEVFSPFLGSGIDETRF